MIVGLVCLQLVWCASRAPTPSGAHTWRRVEGRRQHSAVTADTGEGQAKRRTPGIHDEVALRTLLPQSVEFRPVAQPFFCRQAGTVESSGILKLLQHRADQSRPDPSHLPRAQPPPPTRLAAAAHLRTLQTLPLHAVAQDADAARQRRRIRGARPPTFRHLRLG